MKIPLTLTVNGTKVTAEIEPRMHLADFLREHLRLTATHLGCEHGVCGACTVLVDGEPVRSCLLFAVQLDDCAVETVESLAEEGKLGPVQRAFDAHDALQCGFCTSGFLLLAESLRRRNPPPDAESVRELLASNLCRCTGYAPIVAAVQALLAEREDGRS
ncbi:MAG TPA: (2Fe-2S)-binding protein [Gaiellaceae bacterium]|nr:(2Fe-2S)-binding protein [Gaiellaceae bacterium]